jgi:hypothetical protein
LSVGLLDKTLGDEVATAYPNPASCALLSAEYLSKCPDARWHFECRTERAERCIFGKDADHETESGAATIDPVRRSAVQDVEMALKSWGMPMCCVRARAANFA